MHALHQLGMAGRFAPLSVPSGEGAPPKVAKALQRYDDHKRKYRTDRARQRALNESSVARQADHEDAKARAHGREPVFRAQLDNDRRQIDLDVRAEQVLLDESLLALLAAMDAGGRAEWLESLTAQQSASEDAAAEAWATYITETRKQDDMRRLAGWVERFPEAVKWQGTISAIPADQLTPPSDLQRVMDGELAAADMFTGRGLAGERSSKLKGKPTLGRAAVNIGDDAA